MVKLRKDVAIEDTWDVSHIFKTEEAFHQGIADAREQVAQLVKYKTTLCDANALYEYLCKNEALDGLLRDIYGYSMLCNDVDTQDPHTQSLSDQAKGLLVEIGKQTSFASVEIMSLEDAQLDAFYIECEGLSRFKRLLSDLRRSKNHTLSEAEETLLAAAQEMAATPTNTYMMLTNADLTFKDAVDKDGNVHPLSSGTFINCLESADRELRKSAFKNYYAGYEGIKNTTATLLAAQNKKQKFYAQAKKFDSPLDAALHATNVPTEVYHNLIDTVHKNMHVLHKYMKLRKRVLGVEELHMYDLYVPLLDELEVKIPYEEAKNNVLASTSVLGEQYVKTLEAGFNDRWVDKYENKGKRSGAYSMGMRVHPFVLMNYSESLNTEFTLAHEMGHAMHSYLSNKTQNQVDSKYVIFVAEVASTFNEALLMDYLKNKSDDPKMKAYLINYVLEQFRTTLYRQTMFAEFELKMSELVMNNEALTAQRLCEEYKKLNVLYYGEDVHVDDEIALEYSRIPHFYMNFYVYQYATGFSAAMALSKRVLANEEGAVDQYLEFLSGGCSKSPIDLLKGAGVDMSSPQPIQEALDYFNQLVDALDALI